MWEDGRLGDQEVINMIWYLLESGIEGTMYFSSKRVVIRLVGK